MRKPPNVMDVFLSPGEHWFGDRQNRVRTLLGSCVAITLWHPRRLVGGMCHFMLPSHARSRVGDGRYADEAFGLLFREAQRIGTRIEEYEIKMFGGGNMFPHHRICRKHHVGAKNVEAGNKIVRQHGLTAKAADMGGIGHRSIVFDIWSGHVWVRRPVFTEEMRHDRCLSCENKKTCHVHS